MRMFTLRIEVPCFPFIFYVNKVLNAEKNKEVNCEWSNERKSWFRTEECEEE